MKDKFEYPNLEVVAKAIYYANWRPNSDGSPRPIWENLVPEIREYTRRMAHNALFASETLGTDASVVGHHLSLVKGPVTPDFSDAKFAQFAFKSIDRRSQVDGRAS